MVKITRIATLKQKRKKKKKGREKKQKWRYHIVRKGESENDERKLTMDEGNGREK